MSLDKIPDSPSSEIFNTALQKQAKGEQVYSLAIGEPSFDTPTPIINAALKSMNSGGVHYTSSYGTKEVRDAIVKKVRRRNKIRAGIENTIFLTTKLAVYASLLAVSSENYEALIPDPGYYYTEPVVLSGGKPIRYRLADDYSLNLEEIKGRVTSKTRAIILNTPSNPTGKVLERRELRSLLDMCLERGIRIISDEAYEDLVYDKEHVSIGSMEESPNAVVSLFSLSKSYAMTGWRAGYVVGDEKTVRRINRFLETAVTCFPPFIMAASAYALLEGDRFVLKFREELRKRKELLEDAMDEIPSLEYQETEGAFYSFPRYRGHLASSAVARKLLNGYNVAVLPGAIFGPSGEGHLRISFASSEETLAEAMHRLKAFFEDSGGARKGLDKDA
ncbi:MAG: pyridoxal phosphate-dependent aminotransferase [Thaumarchaeota archaeon]|nr:pyridoxal phosphate-dependent aminotransferase [Nitrososphaerota archaeon]